jgi:hypothetical protein
VCFWEGGVVVSGHIISQKGVSTDPSKNEVMKKYPTPTSVIELRGFFGFDRVLYEICAALWNHC